MKLSNSLVLIRGALMCGVYKIWTRNDVFPEKLQMVIGSRNFRSVFANAEKVASKSAELMMC